MGIMFQCRGIARTTAREACVWDPVHTQTGVPAGLRNITVKTRPRLLQERREVSGTSGWQGRFNDVLDCHIRSSCKSTRGGRNIARHKYVSGRSSRSQEHQARVKTWEATGHKSEVQVEHFSGIDFLTGIA